MDVFRLAGLAVITAMLALTLRSYRPEIAMQTALAGGAVILLAGSAQLAGIYDALRSLGQRMQAGGDVLMSAVRVTGIAYIVTVASEICRDAGENALAAKTQICGRLMLLAAVMPQLSRLAETLIGLVEELPG